MGNERQFLVPTGKPGVVTAYPMVWFAGVEIATAPGSTLYHPEGYCPVDVKCDACVHYPEKRPKAKVMLAPPLMVSIHPDDGDHLRREEATTMSPEDWAAVRREETLAGQSIRPLTHLGRGIVHNDVVEGAWVDGHGKPIVGRDPGDEDPE